MEVGSWGRVSARAIEAGARFLWRAKRVRVRATRARARLRVRVMVSAGDRVRVTFADDDLVLWEDLEREQRREAQPVVGGRVYMELGLGSGSGLGIIQPYSPNRNHNPNPNASPNPKPSPNPNPNPRILTASEGRIVDGRTGADGA